MSWSICDLYHRKPHNFVAQRKALLEHLGDHILAQRLILAVHHRVVQRRIERLARRAEHGERIRL